MNTKLYIENLAAMTTRDDLMDLFSAFGQVRDINIAVDHTIPNPCVFGFVTMTTAEGIRSAIRSLNGKVHNGCVLTVKEAYPPDRKPRIGALEDYQPAHLQ